MPNALGKANDDMGLGDAVIVSAPRTLYVSGQVSVNEDLEIVGTTLPEQMRQAYKNVAAVLDQAGARFQDVVQMQMFIDKTAAVKGADFFKIIEDCNREFNPEGRPACTGVFVDSLAIDGLLIEVQVIAAMPAA
ncbi:RidA family protein [Algiphilus sp.]|uniref:RidA family protein n=1 Tax=Algiphilus sp. TaxID=1872431 RepID=UPI003BACE175